MVWQQSAGLLNCKSIQIIRILSDLGLQPSSNGTNRFIARNVLSQYAFCPSYILVNAQYFTFA